MQHQQQDYRSATSELVESNNSFSIGIFKRLATGHENVFISPLSLSIALSMAACGASEGEVKDAMRSTLCHNKMGSEESVKTQFKSLIRNNLLPQESLEFMIANSAWYKEGETKSGESFVRGDYKETVNEYFNAEVAPLTSAAAINEWCNEKTKGRIKNIIDALPRDAVMVLVNTIYFKAGWENTFSKEATKKELFKPSQGEPYQVDMMMRHSKDFWYLAEEGRFQLVQLDYAPRSRFCASVILPDPSISIDDFVNSFTLENWNQWRRTNKQEGTLHFPRIKVEWGTRSVKGELDSMGMSSAFKGDAFNRIGSHICISDVLHKTVLEVDEEGTEAAAATAVMMLRACLMRPGAPPFEMKVDRPFLFVISEKATGNIIFLGKIERPQ